MSMTLVILLLVVFGLILVKVKPGWALLSLGVALVLFVNTPVGAPIPGNISHFFQGVSTATVPLTNGGGQG